MPDFFKSVCEIPYLPHDFLTVQHGHYRVSVVMSSGMPSAKSHRNITVNCFFFAFSNVLFGIQMGIMGPSTSSVLLQFTFCSGHAILCCTVRCIRIRSSYQAHKKYTPNRGTTSFRLRAPLAGGRVLRVAHGRGLHRQN